MKKALLFIIFLPIFLVQTTAQDFIQNGGFEQFIGGPSENDNLTSTIGWDYIDGFPEYYHNNFNNVIGAVPLEGDGVVAVGFWVNPSSDLDDQTDAIGTRLLQTMVAGNHYVLSFYVKSGWWDPSYCTGLKIMGAPKAPINIPNLSPFGQRLDPETVPGVVTIFSTPVLQGGYEHFRVCVIPEVDITYLFFKGIRLCSAFSIEDYLYLDNVSLFEEETFDLFGMDTTLCAGQTLELDASFQNAEITWDDGYPDPVRTVREEGTYSVVIETINPVCPITDAITVNYNLIPIPDKVLVSDTTICYGTSLLLDASTPDLFYQWQNGSSAPTFNVIEPGDYAVTLSNGTCEKEDEVSVGFFNCMECDFYVPNIFSPN